MMITIIIMMTLKLFVTKKKSRATEHYRKMRMIAWFMARRYYNILHVHTIFLPFEDSHWKEFFFSKNIFHLHSVLYREQQKHPINWNELFSIMIYYIPLKKWKDCEWTEQKFFIFKKFIWKYIFLQRANLKKM